MTEERQDLTEFVKKETSLEHDQKLMLMGVIKGFQMAEIFQAGKIKPQQQLQPTGT